MPIYYFLSFFVIKKNKKNELKIKSMLFLEEVCSNQCTNCIFNIFLNE